jgi:hypothetical protein
MIIMRIVRRYSELEQLTTFDERFEYLKLGGGVGRPTFGYDRYLNQNFYGSREWDDVKSYVIYRDSSCDLGILDREIHDRLLVHHMNPMTTEDILHGESWILDPEFLITTTHNTHNAIHYAGESLAPKVVAERSPGDTKLW